MQSHTILHLVDSYIVNVCKYTSPMDGMAILKNNQLFLILMLELLWFSTGQPQANLNKPPNHGPGTRCGVLVTLSGFLNTLLAILQIEPAKAKHTAEALSPSLPIPKKRPPAKWKKKHVWNWNMKTTTLTTTSPQSFIRSCYFPSQPRQNHGRNKSKQSWSDC